MNSTSTDPHIISDKFLGATGVALGHTYITGSGLILVAVLPDQTVTTVAGAKQWFSDNPTHFIYELDTPVKVADIDPLELVSMLGVNNIWTDTGDCEVEYRADPALATQ